MNKNYIVETRYETRYIVESHLYVALLEITSQLWTVDVIYVRDFQPRETFCRIAEKLITSA